MTCISDARSTALTSLCCLVSIHLLPHNVTALSSSTMKPPVLVVGAGPVGLTAANSLARFGIPVRIIDSNACPSKLSKALVMWRRSLHTLDGLIPYEQWLQHGRHVGGLDLADAGAIFAALDLQQPPSATAAPAPCQHMLPAGVLHTQSQIEAELEQHLQDSYGITVERSTKLESFTVDEVSGQIHCVLASTSQPDPAGSSTVDSSSTAEAQREMVASYLIGCDGARSAVRKGLGVPFPGFSDPDNRFLMMDCTYEHEPGINSNMPRVEAEGLPAPDRPMASTTAIGLVLVISLVDVPNAVRLVWNAGRDGPAQPTLADYQSVLMAHTRLQIRLKEVLWQSEFSVNERQVDSYVHHGGRVLLAGDAAHVHSPAGGQGMNTGIQDASNLAWKVALAAAGDVASAHELLQTYQEERHPVGKDAVRFSGALLRANAIRSPIARFVRRIALSVVMRIAYARQMLIATAAEDTVSYINSSLAKAVPAQAGASASPAGSAQCAGTAFPDVSVSVGGVMRPATDLLRGGEGCFGTLVLLTPPQSPASSSNAGAEGSSNGNAQGATGWPTHWGHWPLHAVSVARQGAPGSAVDSGAIQVVDEWGVLSQAVGGADGVLVRPDGIIAAAGGPEIVKGWLKGHGMVANLQMHL